MYYPPHPSTSSTKHLDGPNVGVGVGGGWGRFPIPTPGQYPGLGYPPPGGHGHHHPHHHPTFGNGAASMHMPQQNTGGMGMAGGFGMGMYGGQQSSGQSGSPPRQGAESTVPLTAFWQHQLLRAEVRYDEISSGGQMTDGQGYRHRGRRMRLIIARALPRWLLACQIDLQL